MPPTYTPEDHSRAQALRQSLAMTGGGVSAVSPAICCGSPPRSVLQVAVDVCCGSPPRSVLQVAVDVCRNEILCELLPTVLRTHMQKLYGDDVPLKVKADMFEAIVGAVYDSELGLDMVRRVVADLYHQHLHDAMKRKEGNPEAHWKFSLAMQLCPYVHKDASLFVAAIQPFHCKVIMVGKNQELLLLHDDSGGVDNGPFGTGKKRSAAATAALRKYATKDYATHFTTGTVYSYRRLGEHDLPAMHNRVLQLFQEGSIGFVNETLGEVTKLTFDIDGVNMKSYGLVHILKEWIRATWGQTNTSPCALILNCSGRSVVSKKQKYSCHVHIPDRVVSISELMRQTSSLRRFIVDFFSRNVREQCLGTGSIVTGNVLATQVSHGPPRAPSTIIIGRIVLDMQLMQKRLASVLEHDANTEWASAFVDANGYRSLPVGWTSPTRQAALLLSFLSLKDLLAAMTVSKTFYRAGTLLLSENMENPDGWIRQYLLSLQQVQPAAGGDAKSPLKSSTKASLVGSSDINLRCAQVVHVLNSDFTWSGRFILCECARNGFSYVRTSQDVEQFVDEHGAGKPKRFFEQLQPFLDKSIFDTAFWEKTVDHGLVESKKLRLYLNDKFDTVYGQEFRPLLFASVVDPHATETAAYDPSISNSLRDDRTFTSSSSRRDESAASSLVNHRALLLAATLRSPNTWNAFDEASEMWESSIFADLPCVDVESTLNSEVNLEELGNDQTLSDINDFLPRTLHSASNATPDDCLPRRNRRNTLPSFNDIRQAPFGLVSCNDWQLWCSGLFSITEVREDGWGNGGGGGGSAKIQRHGALLPASWTYCDKTRNAVFQVLGEALFFVASVDLASALSDFGAKGMMMLSRILTPHVFVDSQWRSPSNQSRSWLELSEETGRGGLGGNGQSVAQQQQQPRGSGKSETVVVNGVELKTVGATTSTSVSSVPRLAPPAAAGHRGGAPLPSPTTQPVVAQTASAHTNFEETAAYFRMKFDRIDFQMMDDIQGCVAMLDGTMSYLPLDHPSDVAVTDLAVATAIRRWTKSWQGLVDGRGALVATSRPALSGWFLNVASDAFAPYLTVQLLSSIKPSKKATAELRAALATTEPPFTGIIYAEKNIDVPKFYWLLERLQHHGTCWFVFSQAYEDARKLRGTSCFNS
ncbi:Hypothetical protein, putative [Bodo saltans]|uniref:Uncharacterized protein n=1 Tax=Bodo saltans TaxID=75058 RepID=A0A0S4JNU8_BODSA|nr:Hypothetical protein, putative [Bodo saltans]|eukprot:CUG90797.1 Hypothetical protein, putative [Bodo saltans]